jgi:hypothetical protein
MSQKFVQWQPWWNMQIDIDSQNDIPVPGIFCIIKWLHTKFFIWINLSISTYLYFWLRSKDKAIGVKWVVAQNRLTYTSLVRGGTLHHLSC